jgi:hypothetical protein
MSARRPRAVPGVPGGDYDFGFALPTNADPSGPS